MGKKKAFFLDRDGVINENRPNMVRTWDEFEFLEGAAEAVRKINDAGWLVVVVTNQSIVNRGIITREALENIHRKMMAALAEKGAEVDAVYYCPHMREEGCQCRKPKPGMLLKAAEDLDINLSQSVMAGDLPTDVEAGHRAGVWRSELISKDRNLLKLVNEVFGA